MSTNETLNRWNHKKWPHQINPATEDNKTIAIGDMDAAPMTPEEITADILAMDKETSAEIIMGMIHEIVHVYGLLGESHDEINAMKDDIRHMRTELDLLKGGALEVVRKSEEAAREMAIAREKYAPVVKRLREEGLSWNQIAEMTGINRSTIRQWVK